MALHIKKIGVIGAGTMGAGIAAQAANAGLPVVLLDIVPAGATNRNTLAEGAVQRLLKTEPAAFMHEGAAKLIETGNTEDHLAKLADCDWIVEAIIEDLTLKQALYARLEQVRRPGSAISSNTSTIPLALLTEGRSQAFRQDFLITHFFNPPRYMRLLEIVSGSETNPETASAVAHFADVSLGKTVIDCQDSPGFIANRLGIYWMQLTMLEAMNRGLTVEQADAVYGRPMGIPKTGVFGLLDLVGIDLGPHLNASMRKTLPPGDAFLPIAQDVPLVTGMIAKGLTGRKGKGGFYKMQKAADGSRQMLAIDLATGEYRPAHTGKIPEIEAAGKSLRALLEQPGKLGAYAKSTLIRVIAYAASLVPTAAKTLADIDAAMRLGYNWKFGPFELADQLGPDWLIAALHAETITVPPLLQQAAGKTFYKLQDGQRHFLGLDGAYHPIVRPEGVLLLADIKQTSKPVLRNGSASLWDIGDGVVCFEVHSKSNTLDPDVMALLTKSIDVVEEKFKALVIYTDEANFSLGANLGLAVFAANIAAWSEIEKNVATGQQTYLALKYAPFPVVAAPAGMALGGGCELVLHADAAVAHAETYIGLVEAGVGLIPGWGGCKEMLARWRDDAKLPRGPVPAPAKVFETVSVADVSKSAHQARAKKFLRETDGITMNRDRLLADAKARALALVPGYTPPKPPEYRLPGPSGRLGFNMAAAGFARRGMATKHDLVVADALAEVLSGGEADLLDTLTEQDILDLERRAFMRLARTKATLARIEHTLETGKPLRN